MQVWLIILWVLASLSQPIYSSLGVRSKKSEDIQITPRYFCVTLSLTKKLRFLPILRLFFMVDKNVLNAFQISEPLAFVCDCISAPSVQINSGCKFKYSSGSSGNQKLFFTSCITVACSGLNIAGLSSKKLFVSTVGYLNFTSWNFC